MTKEMELYRGGSWDSAYTYLGAHPAPQGYTFRVWAPHARHVALAGDFNGWQPADMHRDEDGVWSLTAENAGGEVVLRIMDDGAGLNREKILTRAREHHLFTKPESELTDKEIYSFIFAPGFSTKDKVTEFSGRGVGMDVVMSNIKALSGNVIVDSVPGKGSTTTLKIPLTLAIIEGMSVAVGSATYTIPIQSIRQSFRPDGSNLVRDPEGNEMVMVRGDLIYSRRWQIGGMWKICWRGRIRHWIMAGERR